ncbi:MAG: hypothetical protein WCP46_00685 [Alphaproteobacteria bacterium]
MLKLAGVKDEKSFYKKYPSEEAFMQQHGEAFNKLVNGGSLKKQAEQSGLIMDYGANGIHINPANKGKFTATKKATGKSTEELTHSKNPVTRKRAIFAQNASHFKHENGGNLKYIEGMEYDLPIEEIKKLEKIGYKLEY